MDIQVTKGSKMFFLLIFSMGLISLVFSFYRYMVLGDFTVTDTPKTPYDQLVDLASLIS